MIRRPPTSTLFPSPALFRSAHTTGPGARSDGATEQRGEPVDGGRVVGHRSCGGEGPLDRKSTRLNSSHANISYAVFCLTKNEHYFNCLITEYKSNKAHISTN